MMSLARGGSCVREVASLSQRGYFCCCCHMPVHPPYILLLYLLILALAWLCSLPGVEELLSLLESLRMGIDERRVR